MADGRTSLRKAHDEIAELRAEVAALRAAQNAHLGHGCGHCCSSCHCWHGHVHWYPIQGAAGGGYPYYVTVGAPTTTVTPTINTAGAARYNATYTITN